VYQWCTAALGTCTAGSTQDPDFILVAESSTCIGAQLAPNDTCNMVVHFTPTSQGAKLKWLVLKWNNGGSITQLQAFELTGMGLAPSSVTVTPSVHTFAGLVRVNTDSAAQVFTLLNSTDSDVAIGGTLGGTDSGDFVLNLAGGTLACSALGGTLPRGRSCTFSVVFHPTTAPDPVGRVATVTIGGAMAGLIGNTERPATLSIVEPATTNFGKVVVSTTSAPKTFVVTNAGDVPTAGLSVTVIGTAGNTFSATGCGGTLAAGASCNAQVTAGPSALGIIGGSNELLRVYTTCAVGSAPGCVDANNANPLQVQGVLASQILLPTTVTFPAAAAQAVGGEGCVMPVVVQNGTDSNTQTTGPLTIAIADSANFHLITDSSSVPSEGLCAGSSNPSLNACADYQAGDLDSNPDQIGLPGNASCVVWIGQRPQTLPTGDPPTFGTTLTVSGTPGGSDSAAISGQAVAALSWDHSSPLSLGSTTVGADMTRVLTVVNSSETDLPTGLLSVSITGTGYRIDRNYCVGQSLVPSGSCTVRVVLTPAATGANEGSITVSGMPGNSATLALTGTGT
jgi:hypothetical protein